MIQQNHRPTTGILLVASRPRSDSPVTRSNQTRKRLTELDVIPVAYGQILEILGVVTQAAEDEQSAWLWLLAKDLEEASNHLEHATHHVKIYQRKKAA